MLKKPTDNWELNLPSLLGGLHEQIAILTLRNPTLSSEEVKSGYGVQIQIRCIYRWKKITRVGEICFLVLRVHM